MKKILSVLYIATLLFASCSDEYDDSALTGRVDNLENRVAKLEELCKQMNTNISSLQTIVTALQKNDYVTNVTPIMQNGKEVGYTITFSKSNPITIYHGKDGQNGTDGEDGKPGVDGEDGKNGHTPVIGVKQDTDGSYYWTLDGDWLTDDSGNKIKAEGTDGKDGTDGSNGEDGNDGQDGKPGMDGKDGITPKFKIENDYWYISYDNESTWTQLGKATGEDGKDGEDGISGDPMFTDIDYETNTDYVIFTLSNGTQIKLPTWSAFEALKTLCNQMNTNISSLQTIVTALQNNDYITEITPVMQDGIEIGYTIRFNKSNPITIYHGKDGQNGTDGSDGKPGADGQDGHTPVISVKQDTDGVYYWTLDGKWLTDDSGNKIKAEGTDGKMVQTVQMEKMERTERTVKTALLPNSKSERDIGTFPMTMEQTGHSWAKPQVKMGLTELMPFRFSRKLPKMKIISISNCRMIRLFPCPNIIRCLSHSPKPRIFGYWRIKHTRSVIPLQELMKIPLSRLWHKTGFGLW